MSAPDLVVWDIGNVLLNWDPHHLYGKLIPDDDARDAFFSRLPLHEMNLEGDRTGDLEGKVAALAERYPEDAVLILAWWAAWDKMCVDLIDENVAMRDALRSAGIPCWALTNFADDSWARCLKIYPQLRSFDGFVVSGEEKVMKPDAGIYEVLEARTGYAAEQLYFIDDRPANIEAAQARGWRGHIFSSPGDLQAALLAEGLPV